MKIVLRLLTLSTLLGMLFFSNPLMAQVPETVKTEASEPDEDRPLDDIVEKRIVDERRVLAYQPLREADVMWEKRVWRE